MSYQLSTEKLTDVRSTNSVTEQSDRPPGQCSIVINIKEPFQSTNFKFLRKHVGSRTTHFKQNGLPIFPNSIIMNRTILCCVSSVFHKMKGLTCAILEKKDVSFILGRFLNWKKALERFKEHQLSDCHKMAVETGVDKYTSHDNQN